MTTKVKVHSTPTSKLIYFRVYRSESPFTMTSIDLELQSRKFVSLEGTPKDRSIEDLTEYLKYNKGRKALQPRFIYVKSEEEKIKARGRGLENYAFGTDEDFYDFFRIIITNSIKTGGYPEILNTDFMAETLTWSERVLFYLVAKQMISIMSSKARSTDKNSLQPDEEQLHDYFKKITKHFKKSCILGEMNKIPLESSEIDCILAPILYRPLISRIVPTDYFETIWDRLILNLAISKERKLLLTDKQNKLFSSISSLADSQSDVPENIKRLVIEPLRK